MEKEKLKILFLITGLKSGGAERVMANLSNEFVKIGHMVAIVVMKNAETDYELDDRVKFVGANAVNSKGKNNILKGFRFYIKKVKEFNPDIIVSFLPKTNIFAVIGKILYFKNIPVITCERANPASRKGVIKFLNDKLFVKADGCAFQTNEAKEYYNIKDIKKTCILKNPISNEFCVERYNGERKKEIVTAGRLYEQKNHALLIKAFSKIANKYVDYKLIIYGEGPLKRDLIDLSNSLGLSNRVKFPGRVDNINEKIYDASILVLSSDFEGMPNSLLEAMALGLPVVSTDCPPGGTKSIINNYENGVLVPVGDIDKMARSMERVIIDKEFAEKIGKNASSIQNEYSRENVINEWENFIYRIFENFINGRK